MSDDLPAVDDDGPGDRAGQDVVATKVDYQQGTHLIIRRKKHFTEWVCSSTFCRLERVR